MIVVYERMRVIAKKEYTSFEYKWFVEHKPIQYSPIGDLWLAEKIKDILYCNDSKRCIASGYHSLAGFHHFFARFSSLSLATKCCWPITHTSAIAMWPRGLLWWSVVTRSWLCRDVCVLNALYIWHYRRRGCTFVWQLPNVQPASNIGSSSTHSLLSSLRSRRRNSPVAAWFVKTERPRSPTVVQRAQRTTHVSIVREGSSTYLL